jgi:4-hydroxy-tetrahydrodipicolinate synthase
MDYTKKEAKAYARKNMRGLWGSIPYPFRKDMELDEKGLVSDLQYYIETIKIDGFYMGGIINEFWALTVEERKRAQELLIREAKGKIGTITMTGHTSVKAAIELTKHAERAGADYVAVMNPYYAARTPELIYEYYRAIASEVDIGILILNSPTSGYILSPQQVAKLAEIDNICAIKNDAAFEHTTEIRRLAGDMIVVSDPNEDNWLINRSFNKQQVFMASPSPHLMQWANHMPIVDYTKAADAGDMETAKRIAATLNPLRALARKWIWTPWATGALPMARLKYWQKLMGLTGGYVRPPLLEMNEAEKAEFRKELVAAGVPVKG